MGTKRLRTTIYHPDGNSPVERFHKELKRTMRQMKPLCDQFMTVEEAIAWSLLTYRALPHSTTGESPAYLTHGKDIIFQNTFLGMLHFYLNPIQHSRNEVLNQLRLDLIRRHIVEQQQIEQQNVKKKPNNHKVFKLGDLVLLALADGQIRHIAELLGSGFKLTNQWSLPMRVTHVNKRGTTATLRCTSSGFTTQAHITRVQFIKEPTSAVQQAEWKAVCDKEVNAYMVLGSYYSDHYEKDSEEELKEVGTAEMGGNVENSPLPTSLSPTRTEDHNTNESPVCSSLFLADSDCEPSTTISTLTTLSDLFSLILSREGSTSLRKYPVPRYHPP